MADARRANSLDVGFSMVGMLDGRTDVYPDSVVVLVRDGQAIPLRPITRFAIPRAPGESLDGRWVVFSFHLTVPRTSENPNGQAWTYTHARKE